MNQTPNEETLQKAIQFYEKVRVTASSRLSFAPLGGNGLRDGSGAISSHSLSEMWDVCFQRIEHVMRSLVEHSELPDQVHELSLQESSEARLAATICTGYFTWMIADVTELLSGGALHTVSPMIDDMMQRVGPPVTSRSTSLRSSLRQPNLQSTNIQAAPPGGNLASEGRARTPTRSKNVRQSTQQKKKSTSTSPTGKKRPSAKKKKGKSKKRSVRKRGS